MFPACQRLATQHVKNRYSAHTEVPPSCFRQKWMNSALDGRAESDYSDERALIERECSGAFEIASPRPAPNALGLPLLGRRRPPLMFVPMLDESDWHTKAQLYRRVTSERTRVSLILAKNNFKSANLHHFANSSSSSIYCLYKSAVWLIVRVYGRFQQECNVTVSKIFSHAYRYISFQTVKITTILRFSAFSAPFWFNSNINKSLYSVHY